MECPYCGEALRCEAGMESTCYRCEPCGLWWFNAGELENLLRGRHRPKVDKTPAPERNASPRPACPACGPGAALVPMRAAASNKVGYLGCTVCFGQLFSGEELRRLMLHTTRGPVGLIRRLF